MNEYPSIHRRIRDLNAAINSDMHELVPELTAALSERRQLIAWQAEAVELIKQWQRCLELVPASRLILGARHSACVYAYIDHLHNEIAALVEARNVDHAELEVLRTICADRQVQP